MNKKKEQTPAEFQATAKNLAYQLCPAQKHLDNIIKIVNYDEYEEIIMVYLRAYLQFNKLADCGLDAEMLDLEMGNVNNILNDIKW